MIESTIYNWKIYRVLRKLSRQRVGMVLQPGNVWVIEYAVKDTEENRALLHTCQLRGWVEVLHESIPSGQLNEDGSFSKDGPFNSESPIWRLTDGGWSVIQRRHQLTLLSVFLAVIAIIITVKA